jgi:hypothetical protein
VSGASSALHLFTFLKRCHVLQIDCKVEQDDSAVSVHSAKPHAIKEFERMEKTNRESLM